MRAADSTEIEAVIIKIMRSTRKISVSGVILICQNMPPLDEDGVLSAIALPSFKRRINQMVGADMHNGVEIVDSDREVVIEDDRNDRDREPQRSGNQCLGNSCRHH